ncbi:MAG: hypothetical protein QNI84_10885 [Henriciella sp.]|nr:hypothetical protein [Henriciella sp.]
MQITIANLLDKDALNTVGTLLPKLSWRDGQLTAGAVAKRVNRNQQADLSHD